MKPFEYASAKSVEEAVSLLGKDGNAKVLAGGIDLLGEMKDNIIAPKRIVSIRDAVRAERSVTLLPTKIVETDLSGKTSLPYEKRCSFGAMTTIRALAESPAVREQFTALAEAAEAVGSAQIRNVATVGGNLCQRPRCWYYRNELFPCLKKGGDTCFAEDGENKYHAIFGAGPCHIVHPSNLAPPLVAFGALLFMENAGGHRNIQAEKFFTEPELDIRAENALKPGEVLTQIWLPLFHPIAWRSAYLEVREKQDFDWPLASATVALQLDGRKCVEARVVLGAVAPIPWRATAAEEVLKGKPIDPGLAAAAGEAATKGAEPMSHNGYKVQLVRTLVKRAVLKAAGVKSA